MKKNSEIIGLKVIGVKEGKQLGFVNDLVINPVSGTVAALLINDGKWYNGAKALPYMAIVGMGEYAVMVESADSLTAVSTSSDVVGLLNADVKIIGAKILTKSGKIIGKASEYLVDVSGKIAACEIELTNGGSAQISNDSILTYGKDVIIISE